MSEQPRPSLAPEHIAELVKGSAISLDVLARAGVYSEHDPKALAKMFGRLPKDWADGRVPAWIVPYRIPFQRDPVTWRAKPAKPFEVRDREVVKLQKYIQPPKTGVHLYFGPSLLETSGRVLNDASVPLWITEGEKKVLSAESHGLSCIGVPGVSQWHKKGETHLHPYFAHVKLEGREVFIAFDEDSLRNKDVRREELAFGRALEAVGALVRIVRLPQDAGKLDDFFATHDITELVDLIADAREGGKLPPDTRGPSESDWAELWPKLRCDVKTERPIQDVDNIIRILLHHPAWLDVMAFDARWEKQLFVKEPPFHDDLAAKGAKVPRTIADDDAARIGAWLAAQRVLGWSKAPKAITIEQAIAVVCQRKRFDGVQRYLSSLVWDEIDRLDNAAYDYFGAEPTRYNRTIVKKWLLSAVARARTPGCQADHVLVLEGAQGCGKTTALRVLAGDEFFSGTLPDITTKEAHEHCVGPWIVELAELDHVRKAEVTALKAFLSERTPRFRPAYGRRTTEHPRRCVFAGSTNDETYLADPTGNRRFWPLRCGNIDLEALRVDRDQIWAQAVHCVRAGETWHIDDDSTRKEAEQEQRERRIVDPWQQAIETHLHGRQRTTVQEVLKVLGLDIERHDHRNANRVVASLKDLGWVRKRISVGDRRLWVYEPGDWRGVPGVPPLSQPPHGRQVIDFPITVPTVPTVPTKTKETGNLVGGRSQGTGSAHAITHEDFSSSLPETGTPGTAETLVMIPGTSEPGETGTGVGQGWDSGSVTAGDSNQLTNDDSDPDGEEWV